MKRCMNFKSSHNEHGHNSTTAAGDSKANVDHSSAQSSLRLNRRKTLRKEPALVFMEAKEFLCNEEQNVTSFELHHSG
eukprot:Awhi_evm1s8930